MRRRAALPALALSFALCGCASLHRVEEKLLAASPAPSAGFLNRPERLASDSESSPFDRMWLSDARDWRKLQKLYVAPVDTSHVLEASFWDKLNLRHGYVERDVERLAGELRERLIAAFRDDPNAHFEIVDSPEAIDEHTAILEVALVELVPNKAVLGAIGLGAWAAPLEIGIPVATLTAFIARGSIAMEANVRDAGTDKVIAMFADRETGKMRIIDLRSLTWYGNAHEVMDGWCSELVDLANAPRDHEVEHPALFSFLPW